MSLRVRFHRGVRPDVRTEVKRVLAGFRKISGARHDVQVIVANATFVDVGDGQDAAGWFFHPRASRSRKPCFVLLAANPHPLVRKYIRRLYAAAGAWRCVGHVLLHELAHYEQWRDCREMTERGVNVRARSLYRQIDALSGA